MIDFLEGLFRQCPDKVAMVRGSSQFTYGDLTRQLVQSKKMLADAGIGMGDVVCLKGDFSLASVASLLALIQLKTVVVPMSPASLPKESEYNEVAGFTHVVNHLEEVVDVKATGQSSDHEIYRILRERGTPGLILFSSGSTGRSKAAVHDFGKLLEKFKVRKQTKNILAFLLFDHIGGLNTLLYTLSNVGTLVMTGKRDVASVCSAIDKYQVQILPTTPTFCNLMILGEAAKNFNLSSLELVTYGTEVMPEQTLKKMNELFPKVKFQQTYGLSEIGIMRSKSESNDSLWLRIGGEGFDTRVVDGMLEVKAESGMLGYLNAPSPYTADGWFMTGDAVETKGELFKILGRKTEIINVGGEKVFPAEVESALLATGDVDDCIVYGEKHPILGTIVVAKLKPASGQDAGQLRMVLRDKLSKTIERFKIPQKFLIADGELFGARYKRDRSVGANNAK